MPLHYCVGNEKDFLHPLPRLIAKVRRRRGERMPTFIEPPYSHYTATIQAHPSLPTLSRQNCCSFLL